MAYGSEGEFTTEVGQKKGQKEAVGSSGVSRGERTLAPLSCPEWEGHSPTHTGVVAHTPQGSPGKSLDESSADNDMHNRKTTVRKEPKTN